MILHELLATGERVRKRTIGRNRLLASSTPPSNAIRPRAMIAIRSHNRSA